MANKTLFKQTTNTEGHGSIRTAKWAKGAVATLGLTVAVGASISMGQLASADETDLSTGTSETTSSATIATTTTDTTGTATDNSANETLTSTEDSSTVTDSSSETSTTSEISDVTTEANDGANATLTGSDTASADDSSSSTSEATLMSPASSETSDVETTSSDEGASESSETTTADTASEVTNTITFADGSATSSSATGVSISESTITITQAGTYQLTGTGSGYTISVADDVTDAVTIVLDGVTLDATSISALTDLYVTIAQDSSLTSTETTIETAGALYISSKNNSVLSLTSSEGHAIKADTVSLDEAVLSLTSLAKDGIHATSALTVTNSDVTINAEDDGIQVEDDTAVNSGDLTITDSTVTVTATDKGITVSDALTVNGNSNVTVVSGDEGLEARLVTVNEGNLTIDAGDDGINATEWTTKDDADLSNLVDSSEVIENEVGIVINGGSVHIVSAGDGLDANGNVTVTGGEVYVTQTSADNAAIDYDGTGIISGGTVWAIGNQGMAQSFSTGSSQSYIMANVSGSAGDTITVTDEDGNIVATTTAETTFGNIVFSTESLTSGTSYTITVSSGATATATATQESSANAFMPGGMGGMTPPDGTMPGNGTAPVFDGTTPPALPDGSQPSFDGTMPPTLPDGSLPAGADSSSASESQEVETIDGTSLSTNSEEIGDNMLVTASTTLDSENGFPETSTSQLRQELDALSLSEREVHRLTDQTQKVLPNQSDLSPQAVYDQVTAAVLNHQKANATTAYQASVATKFSSSTADNQKQASSKTNNPQTTSLPSTGDSEEPKVSALGIAGVTAGLGLFLFRKKEGE